MFGVSAARRRNSGLDSLSSEAGRNRVLASESRVSSGRNSISRFCCSWMRARRAGRHSCAATPTSIRLLAMPLNDASRSTIGAAFSSGMQHRTNELVTAVADCALGCEPDFRVGRAKILNGPQYRIMQFSRLKLVLNHRIPSYSADFDTSFGHPARCAGRFPV